jgi:hypothetical protein
MVVLGRGGGGGVQGASASKGNLIEYHPGFGGQDIRRKSNFLTAAEQRSAAVINKKNSKKGKT